MTADAATSHTVAPRHRTMAAPGSGAVVGSLVRLRFRVMANSLRRSVWQLVAVIIGALYGLGMMGLAVVGLVALAFAPEDLRATVLVLGGSALVLGWTLIPLITAGVDQTLEPAKLMVFPIPMRTLLLALTVCGVLGVPGIVTAVVALVSSVSYLSAPLALLSAIPSALVGLLLCVVASRAVTSLSAGLSSRRRFRELIGIVIFIPLILLGPIIAGAARGIANVADALPGVAEALAWTPLGAPWAVPVAVADGAPLEAVAKFLIALVSLGLLFLLWRWALSSALVSPGDSSSKTVAKGKVGLFGVLPATPAGAITARTLIYWLRDPRYARSLIIVPLIPVLLVFYSNSMGSLFILTFTGPIVAFLLSLSTYADLSYDGTAFATHVIDGVPGRADRIGRAASLGIFGIPLIILATVISIAFAGTWTLLPASLGLAFGVFLAGLGLCSVSSARIVIPVPAPGDNPFKGTPGAGFTTALSAFATWGILLLLSLPVIACFLVAMITGAAVWSWATLAAGVVLGVVFLIVGVRMGGRELDQRAPDLLTRLKTLRGA